MNIMKYRAVKVSKNTILAMIVYTIVFAGFSGVFSGHINYMTLENVVWIMVLLDNSLNEIQEYQTFGYCRKKLFSYCIFGEAIRAFFYGGIYWTAIQILFYPEYVNIYTEGAPETISQYHQCPAWELFLINMIIIFLIRLIFLLDSTRKYPALNFFGILKKEKTSIMPRWRKLLRVIEIPILFLGFIIFCMIVMSSHEFMLKNTMSVRIGIYLAFLAVTLIFLVILWRRIHREKKEVIRKE